MTNLKALRESKGVSQQTVADYLGITRQAYGNYETGKRQADYASRHFLAYRSTRFCSWTRRRRPKSLPLTISLMPCMRKASS